MTYQEMIEKTDMVADIDRSVQQMAYEFESDPGHGWLSVPRWVLRWLNIEHRISWYSYQNGNDAFLEEDSDTYLFLKAYRQRYGTKAKIQETRTNDGDSPIRSMQHYTYYKEVTECV